VYASDDVYVEMIFFVFCTEKYCSILVVYI